MPRTFAMPLSSPGQPVLIHFYERISDSFVSADENDNERVLFVSDFMSTATRAENSAYRSFIQSLPAGRRRTRATRWISVRAAYTGNWSHVKSNWPKSRDSIQ